ncbi:hypothetical protein BKA66DRAFT_513124 [Pyrenochaeta sp. MPI-SDFR-AT-0127]|nr:hypothetical protein BKA66DRAFT_513124 [Pyrenochaeta sp. MPI-SDFR-AT-0127]
MGFDKQIILVQVRYTFLSSHARFLTVLGANAGIGYDTSYALVAPSPNNHVIMGARNQAKGENALSELQDDTIKAAAAKIKADFGRLDVLVNNASIVTPDPTTRESLRTAFDTNVFSAVLLTNAVNSLLKASKSLKIINVSSVMGSVTLMIDPTNPYRQIIAEVYRMTKAALNMLTACQHTTLHEVGGTAWAFCPGYVVTDLAGDRESRISQGLESSETSAQGILEIMEGKRDSDIGKFITKYGEVLPW